MQDRLKDRAAVLAAGRAVVVAVSGGADSAVAAWALRPVTTSAVHIHHGYEASDVMAEAARAIADALGLELTVIRVSPAGTSETAAREARWEALRDSVGDDVVVATGHTPG